mgnify:CR=1 FL=1
MKRKVITGDVRSNVSLGANAEKMELTELEKSESLRITELVKGQLVGVDLIPSKDREKIKPYCIEVNANLGFGGILYGARGWISIWGYTHDIHMAIL